MGQVNKGGYVCLFYHGKTLQIFIYLIKNTNFRGRLYVQYFWNV